MLWFYTYSIFNQQGFAVADQNIEVPPEKVAKLFFSLIARRDISFRQQRLLCVIYYIALLYFFMWLERGPSNLQFHRRSKSEHVSMNREILFSFVLLGLSLENPTSFDVVYRIGSTYKFEKSLSVCSSTIQLHACSSSCVTVKTLPLGKRRGYLKILVILSKKLCHFGARNNNFGYFRFVVPCLQYKM